MTAVGIGSEKCIKWVVILNFAVSFNWGSICFTAMSWQTLLRATFMHSRTFKSLKFTPFYSHISNKFVWFTILHYPSSLANTKFECLPKEDTHHPDGKYTLLFIRTEPLIKIYQQVADWPRLNLNSFKLRPALWGICFFCSSHPDL